MQTRLGLSLISARPSEVLILDEVFDGADMFFREKIKERISKIIDASGAVIFVSHSVSHIQGMCNRVLFLHRGEIIFDGDPEKGLELYQQMGPSK
jgi:ABC-type polysaccharide/polyol phosphate transport system ATPase subunit